MDWKFQQCVIYRYNKNIMTDRVMWLHLTGMVWWKDLAMRAVFGKLSRKKEKRIQQVSKCCLQFQARKVTNRSVEMLTMMTDNFTRDCPTLTLENDYAICFECTHAINSKNVTLVLIRILSPASACYSGSVCNRHLNLVLFLRLRPSVVGIYKRDMHGHFHHL